MKNDGKIKLETLVDKMMVEPNHNPRDHSFRFFVNEYPEAVHEAFDFPGKYKRKLDLNMLTATNRPLEMDCAQLIDPKDDITCTSTINVEHQTYPIENKIDAIYDYKIGLIHQNNIPSNSVVMRNMDLGGESILCESHDQTFKLRVNRVTFEKISKRIKILNDKIENNRKLSLEELMYFPYIAIFVDENHAKESMKELTTLFTKINHISSRVEIILHQHLKNLIRFHFNDNDDECKEMLTMLTRPLYEKDYEALTYKESAELRMKELELKMEQKDQQMQKYMEFAEKQMNDKDKQLEQYREFAEKQMADKDLEIEHLLKEIDNLKRLNSK